MVTRNRLEGNLRIRGGLGRCFSSTGRGDIARGTRVLGSSIERHGEGRGELKGKTVCFECTKSFRVMGHSYRPKIGTRTSFVPVQVGIGA